MKRKILLITTKGCEGCRILDRIIQKALDNYSKDVDYEIKDRDALNIEFLKNEHIEDFPTTIFYQNDTIVYKFAGTKPVQTISKLMTMHFD